MYTIHLEWSNDKNTDFTFEKYNRNHSLFFSGDQVLLNSASPEYFGDKNATNPEELLASALASCHMLTFLAIASKSGYTVNHYKCGATAVMGKNVDGKMSVTEINLTPEISFTGEKKPSPEQLTSLHDKAHRNCFIAQSIQSKVNVL